MTKKRLAIAVGLAAGCLSLTLAALTMLPPGPAVTKSNFDRVEKGMTRAEVEVILGIQSPRAPIPGVVYQDWNREDGARATIVFCDEIVTRKEWRDSSVTLKQKLRRWLRL